MGHVGTRSRRGDVRRRVRVRQHLGGVARAGSTSGRIRRRGNPATAAARERSPLSFRSTRRGRRPIRGARRIPPAPQNARRSARRRPDTRDRGRLYGVARNHGGFGRAARRRRRPRTPSSYGIRRSTRGDPSDARRPASLARRRRGADTRGRSGRYRQDPTRHPKSPVSSPTTASRSSSGGATATRSSSSNRCSRRCEGMWRPRPTI